MAVTADVPVAVEGGRLDDAAEEHGVADTAAAAAQAEDAAAVAAAAAAAAAAAEERIDTPPMAPRLDLVQHASDGTASPAGGTDSAYSDDDEFGYSDDDFEEAQPSPTRTHAPPADPKCCTIHTEIGDNPVVVEVTSGGDGDFMVVAYSADTGQPSNSLLVLGHQTRAVLGGPSACEDVATATATQVGKALEDGRWLVLDGGNVSGRRVRVHMHTCRCRAHMAVNRVQCALQCPR